MPRPEFARFSRVLGRTHLLFRSLAPRERNEILDVSGTPNQRGEGGCHCSGPKRLGANDLRVLLAIMALGYKNERRLTADPKTTEGERLRAALFKDLKAVDDDGAVVDVSFRAIAEAACYKDTDCTRRIKECLDRLAKVVVEHSGRNGKAGHCRMLAYEKNDAGRLFIALHPLLNEVLAGGQYMLVNMLEFSKLESDLDFLLYFALCARIDAGAKQNFNRNTIAGYIWTPGAEGEALKKRLQRLEAPIEKLRSIGWGVENGHSLSDKRSYVIHRPHIEKADASS